MDNICDILGNDFSDRIQSQAQFYNLDGTIPEDLFLIEMRRLWSGYKNSSNDKFEECWKGILHCFNRSLSSGGLNISSATMGLGKTSTAFICLALYSVLYPENGSLMICRTIHECDEMEANLNNLLGEPVALAVHSKTDELDKWKDNIHNKRVVLATHVRYLAANDICKTPIHHYKGSQRTLNIVDESLNFISRYKNCLEQISE